MTYLVSALATSGDVVYAAGWFGIGIAVAYRLRCRARLEMAPGANESLAEVDRSEMKSEDSRQMTGMRIPSDVDQHSELVPITISD